MQYLLSTDRVYLGQKLRGFGERRNEHAFGIRATTVGHADGVTSPRIDLLGENAPFFVRGMACS
jgi:hypothetical protein